MYDYYEGAAVASPVPTHLHGNNGSLGLSPDQAAWRLPGDAQFTGRGKAAKGMVAVPAQFAIGDISTGTHKAIVLGGLLAAAYGIWRYAR